MQKFAAWLVHLFTASGLVAGFLGLLAVADGNYRIAMLWILVTLVIDGIDGTFARMANVKEVLPQVNGKTIDYVIDFFTYAILPAYLFYEAVPMGEGLRLFCCSCMLLSAAIYYGLEGMVSADGKHFVGFPVLWNMFVYLVVFVGADAGAMVIVSAVIVFTVLHFVPILFPYPSQGGTWWVGTLLATIIFIATAVVNVWYYPEAVWWARIGCLLSTAWFGVVAAVDTYSARNRPST